MNISDRLFMEEALRLARLAMEEDEVPVGAVVVMEGKAIGWGQNRGIHSHDPTAHAEILALRMAAISLSNYRMPEVTVYVTLEPCFMCFGAMLESRVKRLVFASREPRRGVTGSLYDLQNDPRLNHRIVVEEGVLGNESRTLLKHFFEKRRGEE